MRYIYIISLFVFTAFVSSCNDWLDVKPMNRVEADVLFEDEAGFQQALLGAYITLSDVSLYGNDLTIGFVEDIVHNFEEANKFYTFEYDDAEVESQLLVTWRSLYNTIANVNLLLDNLKPEHETQFENYKFIKGEALALRAYLHFNLFELYGPVLQGNLEQLSLPYRTGFSNIIQKRMKAKDFLAYVEKDYLEAKELLKEDEIIETGIVLAESVSDQSNKTITERSYRMNYLAVCAGLARYYMLLGDNAKAIEYAEEIVNNEKMQLLQRNDVISGRKDIMFSRELIWSICDDTQSNETGMLKALTSSRTINAKDRDFVYTNKESYSIVDDYRKAFWWNTIHQSQVIEILSKYTRVINKMDGNRDETAWNKIIPMIRLSEMYYILAEAYLDTNPSKSFELLNIVRTSRNLPVLPETIKTDKTVLMDQIAYEYQKEFWGEGKLFYFHKRLMRDIVWAESVIKADKAIFELPIPKDELEYGGNN